MSAVADILYCLRCALRGERRPARLVDANGDGEGAHAKRALVVYLTRPFALPPDSPLFFTHQNRRQCMQLVRMLGRELDFTVDVVELNDRTFRPRRRYDFLLSASARITWGRRAVPTGPRVFLATTLEHGAHNRGVARRVDRIAERRGRRLAQRRVYEEEMPFLREATAIAGFGNQRILGTWGERFPLPLFPFPNYGFDGTSYAPKDFAHARRSFLFFASGSQPQKGLDLLLEIFPRHPDLELWICSSFAAEPDFCEVYRRELYETANVHPVGRVDVTGPQYADLVRRSAFVIHPTASEGQAGSVVQCMLSGLVPVCTAAAGIDLDDFGFELESDDLGAIERTVLALSRSSPEELMARSRKTREVAERDYSEDAFARRWREIFGEILAGR